MSDQEQKAPDTNEENSSSPAEEFRAEQKLQAEAQGLTQDNAVPEQRPIASQRVDATVSPLTQKLIEEGAVPDPDEDPMPKSAYDRADSDRAKREAAKKAEQPAPHVGTVIRVKSGPHEGRSAAVLRVVSYPSAEDLLNAQSGVPALKDYATPAEVEVSFRGDDRDGERVILDLREIEFELVPTGFAGRGAIIGGVS